MGKFKGHFNLIYLTSLGKYLFSISANKAQIHYKTNIDESRLSLLSNDPNTLLYADEFYLIARAENQDADRMCETIFKEFYLKDVSATYQDDNLTDFGKIISPYIVTKKLVAQAINIQDSRLSKLINDKNKRPYAFEVYLIAKFVKKKPSQIFELLYGHLKLNSPEEQAKLRQEEKSKSSKK